MEGASPASFAIVASAAVVAPIVAHSLRRWRVPIVLFELLLGILIGPQVLDWAQPVGFVDEISTLGIAFLMFLAGFEIDFDRVTGAPARLAITSWGITLALGLGVGFVLQSSGFALSELIVGLALTTTALGTLLPILSDRGVLPTPMGATVLAAGAAGEFGPIIAVTLLLAHRSPAHEIAMLVAFSAVAAVVAVVALRPRPPRAIEFVQRHSRTSAQIQIRVAMLLLALMWLLAFELGLDTLLGAFVAGLVFRLATGPDEVHEIEPRLHAIGFGFVIPVFFVASGMRFDLEALTSSAGTAARIPLFLALFVVVRGLPALLVYRHALTTRARAGLALLQATALPLVVVITEIGLASDRMKPENATALVAAGMVSVLAFPMLGLRLLESDADPRTPESEPLGSDAAAP